DGGRWHRTGLEHIHADRREAGNQRGLDHVTGEPRILADEHTVAMLAAPKDEAGRLPHPQRQFRRDHAVGAATDTVSAEIPTNHTRPFPHRVVLIQSYGISMPKSFKNS